MNFDTAFERLVGKDPTKPEGSEGGYSNNPDDPGGETNWGISKRSYPNVDIKNLTRDQAKEIYRNDFWNAIRADSLPPAVAFQTFDFAVNSGIGVAIRNLQYALGQPDDGHWKQADEDAMKVQYPSDVVMKLLALRLDYLTRLPTWATFGRGWAKRIAQNLLYGAFD